MTFDWGQRTYVMGIINATPDSFSGDGVGDATALAAADAVARAVAQARQFLADGADILDVGGESTRPGSVPVPAAEELARVVPVVRALRAALPEATISVDTYRAEVAAAALDAGADWINDVWGLRMDPEMATLAAARGCPVVIMHNRSQPKDVAQEQRLGGRYVGIRYEALMTDIARELTEQMAVAFAAGVREEQIILDPGIGFGKTPEQNMILLHEIETIAALGCPVLIGASRKRIIGSVTGRTHPSERLAGSLAFHTLAAQGGAHLVRVHDVGEHVDAMKMVAAFKSTKQARA